MKYGKFFILLILFSSMCYSATVSFDTDGAAIVDSVRTFVFGAYRNPGDTRLDFSSLTSAKFNMVHDDYFANSINSDYDSADINQWLTEAQAYLDAADAAGFGVVMSLPKEVVLNQDTGNIGLIVNTLEFKPALWFWVIMENPTDNPNIAPTIQAVNDMVKLNDTIHPTVIIDSYAGLNGQNTVGNNCDAIWAKNHRIPFSQTVLAGEINNIKSLYGSKVVWGFCQTSDEIINLDRTGLTPSKLTLNDRTSAVTPRSLRAQAHSAVSGGAMGIIFDIPDKGKHDIKNDTPVLWQGMVDLGDEIEELSPVFLSQDAKPVFHYSQPGWLKSEENRIKGLYGDIENDPPAGLPSKDPVIRWSRSYQGNLYIGMVADHMCMIQRELSLSFTFSKVRQHPGNQIIISATTGNPTVQWDDIPIAIWDINGNDYIQFVLNETDTIVWSFED